MVIIRDDLLGKAPKNTSAMLDYKVQAENGSMYNTPPTYAIYIAGLVFAHLIKNGGIEAIEAYNKKKAALLYDYLDSSALFKPTAEKRTDR